VTKKIKNFYDAIKSNHFEKVTMRCPKCDHTQTPATECKACGLIFTRYKAIQKRKQNAREQHRASENTGKSGIRISSVIVLILFAVAGTYWYTGRSTPDASQPAVVTATNEHHSSIVLRPEKEPTATAQSKPNHRHATQHLNTIEQAKNATVTLETPFGSGSGFFITEEWIVTNRHVIEIDQNKTQKTEYEKAKRYANLEEKKLKDYRKKLRQIPKGPAKEQLIMLIEEKEEELSRALAILQKIEERFDLLERPVEASDIKIILADGSEYYANYMITSDNYDLAILSLFSNNQAKLPRAQRTLRQGDKVYTIGCPVGLRHTVTAGIFSGSRKRTSDGHIFLQTDAPINPGNSGGPLIDEHGFVHGINTSILANTEGIGFAIPIDAVFIEFESALQ